MPVAFRKCSSRRAAEAVEDGEVALVRVLLALAGAAAEHLLEQDAGLDRAEEDDELQVGDVHAGAHQVHGDGDAGVGAVAELADALQRAVHPAGDLRDEAVAPAEGVAAERRRAGRRGDVCGRSLAAKISVLGNRPYALLVLEGVLLELLDDLAVGVGRGDRPLDLGRFELPLVLKLVELLRPAAGSTSLTCSPSFRNTPLSRTSLVTFTTS